MKLTTYRNVEISVETTGVFSAVVGDEGPVVKADTLLAVKAKIAHRLNRERMYNVPVWLFRFDSVEYDEHVTMYSGPLTLHGINLSTGEWLLKDEKATPVTRIFGFSERNWRSLSGFEMVLPRGKGSELVEALSAAVKCYRLGQETFQGALKPLYQVGRMIKPVGTPTVDAERELMEFFSKESQEC